MKKLFLLPLLLSILIILTSCDSITSAIDAIINYFVDIEPSDTTGTENTEFTFKANSNDIVSRWVIDGAIIPAHAARSATELTYSFSPGIHTISVVTDNGATDEVEITVSALEPVFKLSVVSRDNTTELYFDYPILKIEGTDYNIETTGSLNITETETTRIISLQIEVDSVDSFLFINDNMYNLHAIDLQNMNITEFNKLIYLLFPERYEVIPEWKLLKYSLSGAQQDHTDIIEVYPGYITINGERVDNDDLTAVYSENTKKLMVNISYDISDMFLFINNNMYEFFGISLDSMSFEEFVIAADILNRYDGTNLIELMVVYP